MKIIGITGGVGSGKTQVLSYIEKHCKCRIVRSDETAHLLYEPGQECYKKLVALLGLEILAEDKTIDKGKMAAVIFSNKMLLERVNQIVHPEVKNYILRQIEYEKGKGVVDYFFIEAALLIEEHYDQIVDELWYIYADTQIREKRLVENRQYSTQKIAYIMEGQLSEEEFRKHCQVVISNNGSLEETYKQIKGIMGD